jgi:hypothetical protein
VARSRFGVETIFLVIGVGLLLAAAYAYERIVRQPRTWPQSEALIVSSRVINPRGPAHYSPELILRLGEGESAREVRIAPRWSSSSYNVVQSHVERFPAGERVSVAVNPADAADVRYDLTLSVENLLVTAILGLLGLVFAGIGLIAGRSRRPRELDWSGPPVVLDPGLIAGDRNRVARRVGMLFVLIGVIIAAIGALMVRSSLAMLRTWPQVQGLVLQSRVVPAAVSSSRGRGPDRPAYDTSVTFRYVVNDVTIESTTAYGGGTSRAKAEARAASYAPGTRHPVWYRPEDPRLIRFDLGNRLAVFFLPGGLVLMGLVFLGLGGAVWRLS